MGTYSRRRNIRKFWENPLVNLCYTLSVIAFVVFIFAIFACIGGAKCLPVVFIALAAGVGLIFLGKKLNKRKKS